MTFMKLSQNKHVCSRTRKIALARVQNMNGLGKHKSLQGPLDQPPTIYKYAYAILNASASRTQDSPTLPPKIPAHIRARAENGKPTHPLLSQLDTNWQRPTDFTEVFCGLAQTIYHGTMGPPTNFQLWVNSRPLRAIVKYRSHHVLMLAA